MNYNEALNEAKQLAPEALAERLEGCKRRIAAASEQAKPKMDEARKLQQEGQEILDAVEDDRVMSHAIIKVQQERK